MESLASGSCCSGNTAPSPIRGLSVVEGCLRKGLPQRAGEVAQ